MKLKILSVRTLPTVFVPLALFLLPCLSCLSSCKKTDPAELERIARERDELAHEQAITDYIETLSPEQKISQLFLVNVEGDSEFIPVEKTGALFGNRDEGDALVPGGCLLFSYNISDSAEKIRAYTDSIRRFYAGNNLVPPYVAIDQEGGYVNRLRGITSNLVSQKKVTEWFSSERAFGLYAAQARQLHELGIQMNLAPVVEVETDANRDFLHTRSFGPLDTVLEYGAAVVRAYEENGVSVVLKHFPGNSNVDPHTGLPHILFDEETEHDQYFKPFEQLLPHAAAVLMSHAVVAPAHTDSPAQYETPACFSPYWVTQFVREKCGFGGLIFSDDIFMGALAENGFPPEKAAVSALMAGVNCIMLSEKCFGEVAGVLLARSDENAAATENEKQFALQLSEKIANSVRRVIVYKIKAGLLKFEAATPDPSIKDPPPSYVVCAVPELPPFDAEAFKIAYSDGMGFYK